MNRRLVLSLATGALLAAGLAGNALADTSTRASHKVCVDLKSDGRLLPPGYCVGWDDPTIPPVG